MTCRAAGTDRTVRDACVAVPSARAAGPAWVPGLSGRAGNGVVGSVSSGGRMRGEAAEPASDATTGCNRVNFICLNFCGLRVHITRADSAAIVCLAEASARIVITGILLDGGPGLAGLTLVVAGCVP